jgi:hypothetical protein
VLTSPGIGSLNVVLDISHSNIDLRGFAGSEFAQLWPKVRDAVWVVFHHADAISAPGRFDADTSRRQAENVVSLPHRGYHGRFVVLGSGFLSRLGTRGWFRLRLRLLLVDWLRFSKFAPHKESSTSPTAKRLFRPCYPNPDKEAYGNRYPRGSGL